MDGVISRAGLICSGLYPYWVTTCWFTRRGEKKQTKKQRAREREEGVAIDIQVEVREMGRGSCSLCQSWQIHQLPVRCGEEGRRGRRGRLKDPLQAGRRRRKRRRSLLKSVAWSFLVDGRSRRTPFDWWMISYLTGHRRADSAKAGFISWTLLAHPQTCDSYTVPTEQSYRHFLFSG